MFKANVLEFTWYSISALHRGKICYTNKQEIFTVLWSSYQGDDRNSGCMGVLWRTSLFFDVNIRHFYCVMWTRRLWQTDDFLYQPQEIASDYRFQISTKWAIRSLSVLLIVQLLCQKPVIFLHANQLCYQWWWHIRGRKLTKMCLCHGSCLNSAHFVIHSVSLYYRQHNSNLEQNIIISWSLKDAYFMLWLRYCTYYH